MLLWFYRSNLSSFDIQADSGHVLLSLSYSASRILMVLGPMRDWIVFDLIDRILNIDPISFIDDPFGDRTGLARPNAELEPEPVSILLESIARTSFVLGRDGRGGREGWWRRDGFGGATSDIAAMAWVTKPFGARSLGSLRRRFPRCYGLRPSPSSPFLLCRAAAVHRGSRGCWDRLRQPSRRWCLGFLICSFFSSRFLNLFKQISYSLCPCSWLCFYFAYSITIFFLAAHGIALSSTLWALGVRVDLKLYLFLIRETWDLTGW